MVKEIRMLRQSWVTMFLLAGVSAAQSVPAPAAGSPQKPAPAKTETAPAATPKTEPPKAEPAKAETPRLMVYTVETGTRIPLESC